MSTPSGFFEWIVDFTIELAIYLESGFIKISNTALCNASSYTAEELELTGNSFLVTETAKETAMQGVVNVNPEAAYPFEGGYNEDGVRIAAGYESLSVGGGIGPALSQIELCGVVYDTKLYYSYLRTIKLAQRFSPSSVYSGKMRLLVQSIYGAMRTDYGLISEDNLTPGIQIGGKSLPFEGISNSGLLTTADYTYYIVEFGSEQTTFTKLKTSSRATLLINELKAGSFTFEERSKAEAYILSTAKIDDNYAPIVKQGVGVIGSPLGYGWHFNTMGNEARIVCHQLDTDGNHKNISREYKVTVDDNLNVTSVLEKTSDWYRDKSFIPWSVTYFPPLANVQIGEHADWFHEVTDAGLYGYYNGDSYKRCAITVAVNFNPPNVDEDFPYELPLDGTGCGEWIEKTRIETTWSGGPSKAEGTVSLTSGSESKSGSFKFGVDYHAEGTYKAVQEGSVGPYDFVASDGNSVAYHVCGGQNLGAAIGWEIGSFGHYWPVVPNEKVRLYYHSVSPLITEYTNMADTYKTLFALSFYDCNHVVLGEFVERSYDSKNTEYNSGWGDPANNGSVFGHYYKFAVVDDPFNDPETVKYYGDLQWKSSSGNNFNTTGTPVLNKSDGNSALTSVQPSISYASEIVDGYQLDSVSYIDSGGATNEMNWITNHFYPDLLLPLAYTTFIARGTYGGADKMRFVDKDIVYQTNVNGYPDGFDSATGWM